MHHVKLNLVGILLAAGMALVWCAPATAAEEGGLEAVTVHISDKAALQRGAGVFVNYCLSCHSAKYERYKRLATDLGLSDKDVMNNMVFSNAKIGNTMTVAMKPEDAAKWFGKAPPDLSLIGRSRGASWLYAYLHSFYRDDAGKWNNTVLENAAMPNVLWKLQGIQKPVMASETEGDGTNSSHIDHLELDTPGLLSPEEYDRTVRDLVTFLEYLGEPAKVERKGIGIWVMLYLLIFALLAYLLKAEYWRDVH